PFHELGEGCGILIDLDPANGAFSRDGALDLGAGDRHHACGCPPAGIGERDGYGNVENLVTHLLESDDRLLVADMCAVLHTRNTTPVNPPLEEATGETPALGS